MMKKSIFTSEYSFRDAIAMAKLKGYDKIVGKVFRDNKFIVFVRK